MVREVSPGSVAARLAADEQLVLLDVREPWEIEIASLPNTVRIPMGEIQGRYGELSPTVPTVVLCRSGARSRQVAAFLESRGFAQVDNLTGGILAWGAELDPNLPAY